MLKWKDEYSIGVDTIDEQHKRLFEIGNRAYAILEDEFSIDKYDEVVQVIDELREYTKYHFESEEAYMRGINYRRYFTQKVTHDDFIKKINEINFDEVDENPEESLKDILAFIFNWTLEHILKEDKMIQAE